MKGNPLMHVIHLRKNTRVHGLAAEFSTPPPSLTDPCISPPRSVPGTSLHLPRSPSTRSLPRVADAGRKGHRHSGLGARLRARGLVLPPLAPHEARPRHTDGGPGMGGRGCLPLL